MFSNSAESYLVYGVLKKFFGGDYVKLYCLNVFLIFKSLMADIVLAEMALTIRYSFSECF